jgi:hypothetical protein
MYYEKQALEKAKRHNVMEAELDMAGQMNQQRTQNWLEEKMGEIEGWFFSHDLDLLAWKERVKNEG